MTQKRITNFDKELKQLQQKGKREARALFQIAVQMLNKKVFQLKKELHGRSGWDVCGDEQLTFKFKFDFFEQNPIEKWPLLRNTLQYNNGKLILFREDVKHDAVKIATWKTEKSFRRNFSKHIKF